MKRRAASGHAASRAMLFAALALALGGSAYADETWILLSPVASAGAELSYGIAVGGTDVVIGAPGENAMTGAVYAVDCSTSPCAAPARIAPIDLAAGNAFGVAVAISGDTFVASAPGPEPGAVYVFVRSGASWTQQARLTATGGTSGETFGAAVSLSGDRLAVGADHASNGDGAVYVFVRSGAVWSQETRVSANALGHFGAAVALDGDTLVAGAPFESYGGVGNYSQGRAYVYTRTGATWTQQGALTPTVSENAMLFGFSVDVAGDRAVIGAPYAASAKGAAFVFARAGSTWSQQATLDAGSVVGDEFGWSVALGGDHILVGAPFAGQNAGASCGAGYAFDGATLAPMSAGSIAQPVLEELAGWAVAADGSRWVTSAPGYLIGADEHAGAAYWFDGAMTIFESGFELPASCVEQKTVAGKR